MERITKRIGETHACYAICEKECPDGIYEDNPACKCTASHMALNRLLEYEDTGLTPAEVQELKERDTAKMCKQSIFDHDSITCVCGSDMDKDVEFMFCPWCGQRLKKWEE